MARKHRRQAARRTCVSVDIPALVAQSPAVVLAVLVWLELRAVRVTLHDLGAAIAVLADRDRKELNARNG